MRSKIPVFTVTENQLAAIQRGDAATRVEMQSTRDAIEKALRPGTLVLVVDGRGNTIARITHKDDRGGYETAPGSERYHEMDMLLRAVSARYKSLDDLQLVVSPVDLLEIRTGHTGASPGRDVTHWRGFRVALAEGGSRSRVVDSSGKVVMDL